MPYDPWTSQDGYSHHCLGLLHPQNLGFDTSYYYMYTVVIYTIATVAAMHVTLQSVAQWEITEINLN